MLGLCSCFAVAPSGAGLIDEVVEVDDVGGRAAVFPVFDVDTSRNSGGGIW